MYSYLFDNIPRYFISIYIYESYSNKKLNNKKIQIFYKNIVYFPLLPKEFDKNAS